MSTEIIELTVAASSTSAQAAPNVAVIRDVSKPTSIAASSLNDLSAASISSRAADGPSNAPEVSTENLVNPVGEEPLKPSTSAFVITSVASVTAISAMLAGVVTVAIPQIAIDINLSQSLLLWPASVFALVSGCTLLLAGSATDVFGSRTMYLFGCAGQCAFVLACGLSRTGTELIAFRALSGLANSLCLPSATRIITNAFPSGSRRNVAFASMSGGQPIGFAIGLTFGGVLTDSSVGWRFSFYLGAILTAIVSILAAFTIPKDEKDRAPISWSTLLSDIDWIGAVIISISLAGLSYVFASITSSVARISDPATASILGISLLLLPVFSLWVHRQTVHQPPRPALIPNKLWKSWTFTSLNLAVFMVWGSFNALEQLLSFYFQYVQKLSATSAALRFLPEAGGGLVTNFLMGAYFARRVRGDWIVAFTSAICVVPPILMALSSINDGYWTYTFWAVILNPIGADCLFTISNLVITDIFPSKDHGLAGGVFNTVSNIGKSVGLAVSGVIANTITAQAAGRSLSESASADSFTSEELLQGYRAAFWYCFALYAATIPVAAWGLRKVGKVGEKKD